MTCGETARLLSRRTRLINVGTQDRVPVYARMFRLYCLAVYGTLCRGLSSDTLVSFPASSG